MSTQFMKIGNVEGSSTEDNHSGWHEISSLSYGVGNAINAVQAAKGKSTGAACAHSNVSVEMEIDKATPELMAYCSVGKCWDKAEFHVIEDEDDPLLTMKLEGKVAVTSCSVKANGEGSPKVTLGLAYSKISWKYKTDKELYWDLKTNKGSLKAK